MKKMLLVLGVAAAAMTSCTSDEVLEMNQGDLVKFNGFVNKNSRSTAVAVNPLETFVTGFYVFGEYRKGGLDTEVFDNVAVTYNNNEWTTSTPHYWINDAYYQFAAYADGDGGDLTNIDSDEDLATYQSNGTTGVYWDNDKKMIFTNYQVGTNDLVAANAVNKNKEVVDLTFGHLLSRIQFQFFNKSTVTGVTMDVKNIAFSVKSEGDCTYDYTDSASPTVTWNNLATLATNYTFDDFVDIAKDASSTTISILTIPDALNDDVVLTFDVDYKIGSEIVETKKYTAKLNQKLDNSSPTDHTWTAGTIYNYIANLPVTPTYITFSPTITPWGEAQDVTLNITERQ